MTTILNATYSILLGDDEIAYAYFSNPLENAVCEITFKFHIEGTNAYYRRYELNPPIGEDPHDHVRFVQNAMKQFFNGVDHEFPIRQKRKTWRLDIENGIQGIIVSKDNTNFGNGTFVYLPSEEVPRRFGLDVAIKEIINDIANNPPAQ